ncbi:MAG: hypothetical protein OEV64_02475 [Desulfobulbaceae bacterium]|nr:hypothetical protein [Desulfobulbaceae bacterium]
MAGRCIHDNKNINGKRIFFSIIILDLLLLGYYKYINFGLQSVNYVFGFNLYLLDLTLPIAISFYTFQQIAFIVDVYTDKFKGKVFTFLDYALFVSFFPQLIAGPIVHYSEMFPQFDKDAGSKLKLENISAGLSIFVIGLFKKVIIADSLAVYANTVFDAALGPIGLDFLSAWIGALCYTFQLYFDFSGYMDMAMGSGRLFGIVLPHNFDSPYKSSNITEFWRRWHITLSRFLRDYLYIPLGGNRKGGVRRTINVAATMLLGGLWHGAGWTFIFWGGLHGLYLTIHQIFARYSMSRSYRPSSFCLGCGLAGWAGNFLGVMCTFVAVVVGWVFFRAQNFSSALSILKAMAGLNGIGGVLVVSQVNHAIGWIIFCSLVCFFMPNTRQLFEDRPFQISLDPSKIDSLTRMFHWRPNTWWLGFVFTLFLCSLYSINRLSEFLYYQF